MIPTPTKTISRLLAAAVAATVMLVGGLAWSSEAQADVSDFGIDSVSASLSTTQAGAHPDLTQGFDLKRDPSRA